MGELSTLLKAAGTAGVASTPTGALAVGVPAAISMGKGIYDLFQARKYGQEERPMFDIPDSAVESLNIAQRQAAPRHMIRDSLKTSLQENAAGNLENIRDAVSSSASSLGAITDLNANVGSQLRGVETQDLLNYQERQNQLRSELGNMSGLEQQQWQWDKAQPYLQAMETAKMFEESGWQNIMGGVKSAGENINWDAIFPEGSGGSSTGGGSENAVDLNGVLSKKMDGLLPAYDFSEKGI